MQRIFGIACFLLVGQADLVDACVVDVRKLPAAQQTRVRYLTAGPHAQPDDVKVIAGHVNGLSRETDLIVPHVVAPGLWRIMIDDYGWKAATFEQLAVADPWYHVKLERTVKIKGKDKVFFRAAQSAHMGHGIAQLVALTQSKAPILRADWFFNQTAAAENRTPNYYDFLGIKSEKDFQTLIGFDAKKKRRKTEIREATANSGIAPAGVRAIIRETSEEGGYWITLDFRKPLEKLNALRVLGRDLDDEFNKAGVNDVATEQFGPLPNDLWAWYLGNNKGERQATAPDFAATDYQSTSNDKKVHVNASCMRCHRNAGVQGINAWIRNLNELPLALQSPDYKELRLARQQYGRRLEPFIDKDRTRQTAAVLECTGWEAKVYSEKYAEYWERYEDARVDAAYAAADCGLTEKEFRMKLTRSLKAGLDPVLTVFLKEGDRKRTIGIRQWEEAFPLAMEIVR